ncbi:acetyltransferase [Shewanella psychrophila]|uniref:Acetyltransferase n=1 Tax=Shewanella psychrophila TaxID=225848 RepID=A0A1S6HMB7_9GAMM|nr:GNAT family N-acetyltransferase [Shewanella psychrophila]AQS36660.1 acetyltransferase [Shewanella psychrophila]
MKLFSVDRYQVQQLMTWFSHEAALKNWAGPNFRYPFTDTSFTEDLKLDDLISYSLITNEGELAGFGQCYRRNDKCHLGRLVIAPAFRGKKCLSGRFVNQKVSHVLIALLSESGYQHLGIENRPGNLSLFVLSHNLPALNLYLHLGFVEAQYPEPIGLDDCLYLVK